MKSFFLEGYGCSLNISETEKINALLRKNNFYQIEDFKKADCVIINTCSVKSATEQRILSRIKYLFAQKRKAALLIVTGCLAASEHELVAKINKNIIVLDTNLSSLCAVLKIQKEEFSPELVPANSKKLISIIPASTGCLGSCSYCSAKLARKKLHSYPVESISIALSNALRGDKVNFPSKEIWLTSQDLGCYGFDIGSSLTELISVLLNKEDNFRLRLGMMNPNHFIKIKESLMALFEDKRLYKFLHLPVQSGSDGILRKMNRKYGVKDFIDCVTYARSVVPSITIATDVIVGFPGETRADFEKTLDLLSKIKPDIINISRFGKRRGTPAEKMGNQIPEEIKKQRSRELTKFCDSLFAVNNKKFLGKTVKCLVSERTHNGFNARTDEYLTVFVKKGFGHFVRVRILEVRAHYLIGKVVKVMV